MNLSNPPDAPRLRAPAIAGRTTFLLFGLAALVAGVWGGMARASGGFPLPTDGWLLGHGPLLVCGFLGTIITLERAVGAGWRWGWAAPLLSGAGAVLLILPLAPSPAPAALFTAASATLVALHAALLVRGPQVGTAVEALGGLAWLGGNLAWLADAPFFAIVPWWLAFPVLTVVGERIALTAARRPLDATALLVPAGVLLVFTGALAALLFPTAWPPIVGAGFVTLAIWLTVADVARETLREPGVPRFTAWCLVTGYAWLAVGGVLMMVSAIPAAGFLYDAVLHAVLVGFVVAMIFAHAPVFLPTVLGRPIPFTRAFYLHLVLLEVAMVLRIVGDLVARPALRTGGGHAAAVALAVFLVVTAAQLLRARRAG